MQDASSNPSRSIIEQAARWHAHIQSGEASAAEQSEFEQWRQADARHAEAYARMQKLWSRFEGAQQAPARAALDAALKPVARKRGRPAAKLALLLTILAAGGLVSQTPPGRFMMADYSTSIGEQRIIELADNSRVTLDSHSAVDIDFSTGQRHLRLLQGKILVEVAKDKNRPFIVETGEGTARALGTQYLVRRQKKATQVTVIESSVEACAANASKPCVTMQPGDSVLLQNQMVGPIETVDIEAVTAWTRFRLVADDMPLADVLRDVQRYHRGHLHFNDQAIESVRVSGVFALDDTAHTLKVLADTTPVRITQYTPWLTVIKPLK
ncbi:FecR family protein [Methylobacillus arboreus]|uniref:FecR family protein n=1 Tax=Methylobacillus arboreus TaxID=755170 RepID=UPI001E649414|nr:FecR family protein [Methylobacillus arboreus]MCB5190926.1 FecR family protein [Methylobacillus arboreus]